METAATVPEWFCPETFSEEVLKFSFRELQVIPQETINTLLQLPEVFIQAVEAAGRAVFTIQSMIHKEMWLVFREGIKIQPHMLNWVGKSEEFVELMLRHYLRCDIFNTVFTLLAVIGELILFSRKFTLPFPDDSLARPFHRIYRESLEDEILANGGIEKLVQMADIRFTHSGLFLEAERGRFPNGIEPVNLLAIMDLQEEVAPADVYVALTILRELYVHHEVVPPNSLEYTYV